jgi:hypothetical protein
MDNRKKLSSSSAKRKYEESKKTEGVDSKYSNPKKKKRHAVGGRAETED